MANLAETGNMKTAGLIHDSVVDGPGLRYVVFTQGCTIKCPGCHNPDTWDLTAGTEISVDEIISDMLSNPLTDGLTISGGEPFIQAADCASLAAAAREAGLNVWVFTGYTFDDLYTRAVTDSSIKKLLDLTDVMVEGKYIESERTLSVKWCGSKNQKIIDVPKSMINGKGVLLNEC